MSGAARCTAVLGGIASIVAAVLTGRSETERTVATGAHLAPVGDVVAVPGRPNDLALSPDGRLLAVKTTHGVIIFSKQNRRRTSLLSIHDIAPSFPTDLGGGGSFGMVWTGGSNALWISDSYSRLREIVVAPDGAARWGRSIRIVTKRNGRPASTAPTGIALDRRSGLAYVALENADAVSVVDLSRAAEVARIPVGPAPVGVALADGRLFASCQGRRPNTSTPREQISLSGLTPVVTDDRGIASAGGISVIDIHRRVVVGTVDAPAGITQMFAPSGAREVFIASPHSDEVLRINTKSLRIRHYGLGIRHAGASPTYVLPGTDQRIWVATAGLNQVLELDTASGSVLGGIETPWYPAAIGFARDGALIIASMKGDGLSGTLHGFAPTVMKDRKRGYNAYDYAGAVQFVDRPQRRLRPLHDSTTGIGSASLPPIKHLVYIIKENRSYDEVLGDMPEGDGDRRLCEFCDVTPNHHQLARDFVLLDGFRVNGTLSADGHQWTSQDLASDYVERNMGGFTRSYPSDGTDPLAYSAGGFIWDRVLDAGLTFRDYGEFIKSEPPTVPPTATWSDFYREYQQGHASIVRTQRVDIPRLRRHVDADYPAFDLRIPDQVRADAFIADMRSMWNRGSMPALSMMLLGNDHTAGDDAGFPTPRAAVADNDLALGRIVEALTQGPFWKDTAILVVEDDAQDGLDHVDAHRSVALLISPYTRSRGTDHHFYNQSSFVRLIERTLRLKAMTMYDVSAPDIAGAFKKTPDLTPYAHQANTVPLDRLNPGKPARTASAYVVRPDAGDQTRLRTKIWSLTRS